VPDDALLGYSDRLSVAPGEPIRFFVSSPAPEYDVSLVRLIHGDPNPAGPGFKEELVRSPIDGRHPGRVQPLHGGSHVLVPHAAELCPRGSFSLAVWLCPSAPRLGVQGLVSKLDAGHGWAVLLGPGGAALRIDSWEVGTGAPLLPWEWYLLVCTMNAASGTVRIVQRPARRLVGNGVELEQRCPAVPTATSTPLVIAGWWSGDHVAGHYNGRLEAPRLWDRALSAAEVDALFIGGPVPEDAVADWDFSLDIPTGRVADVSGHEHHGRTVNMPMRGVTGRRWTGAEQDWRRVPSEYGAIHFHDDDLSDAGWTPDHELCVPDLPSGVYAARIRAGEAEDHLPFFVCPPRGTVTAEIAFLAPTLSYLAYANEHFSWSPSFAMWAPGNVLERLTWRDHAMQRAHLLSLYDFHTDGTGNCYSSYLRPLLSLRPRYSMPLISAPHQFNADLHLLDWMETQGFERDIVTDHDLHAQGADLLSGYRVVVTGSHPEYWTEAMLDALETYLDGGGRVMYLGGNGFWWVTSVHPDSPHVIEIRRGLVGSRPWTSRPGEVHHAGTGEFGGQWRYRGRPPQRLVGVGFSAQGSDASRPYRRLPESHDPRAAFIFEGIGDADPIGDFGIVMGAAGGAEIDRADRKLGTPPHALVVARATGYSDMYQAQQDDTLMHDARTGGSVSPLVRADMVFFETPAGGAVFAPGSISWCGSLSSNGYANNVSQVTGNVLRRFASAEPFAMPATVPDDTPAAPEPADASGR
jgi:N,N-dimethylformamidase